MGNNYINLTLKPIGKFDTSHKICGLEQFSLGTTEYINTGERKNNYIVLKSCVNELIATGQKFFEAIYNECQSGIQYINEEFSGDFKIQNGTATALQKGKEVCTYTIHNFNLNFYLYDDKYFQKCIPHLEKALHTYQQRSFRDIKNYTQEFIWDAVSNIENPQKIVNPQDDEGFIQYFFQIRGCTIFEIVNSPKIISKLNWLNNTNKLLNITSAAILDSTTQQDNDQEDTNYGELIACSIGGLAACITGGYALYKAYKYYTAKTNSSSHNSEYNGATFYINSHENEEVTIAGDSETHAWVYDSIK